MDHTKISSINRAQLVNDALNLVKVNQLNFTIFLDLISYFVNETDYAPWKSFSNAIHYIDNVLVKFENYEKFKTFVLRLLDNAYEKFGFEDESDDPYFVTITRNTVLTLACKFDHNDCIKNVKNELANWVIKNNLNKNTILPNLKSVVYCTIVRKGGKAAWDSIWKLYENSLDECEKKLLLDALSCTRDMSLLFKFFQRSRNEKIKNLDNDRIIGLVSSLDYPLILDYYYITHWDQIK